MNLRTRTARSCISHFPEVVVFVTVYDMVCRYVFKPERGSLFIAFQTLFLRAFENRHVEVFRIDVQNVNEVFPCVVYGTLLEVVAEAPVAEHLKHGVVVSVVSHLFQVIVLTAHTQTFLSVRTSARLRFACAKDNVLPLVHTCVREHQRRVVFYDHWS